MMCGKMLQFYYGLMHTGKSTRLIERVQDHATRYRVGVFKSRVDVRRGSDISIRGVDTIPTDGLIDSESDLEAMFAPYDVVYVDEVHFVGVEQVEQMRRIADKGTLVVCFGLSTDWQTHLFAASKRLIEIADVAIGHACLDVACDECLAYDAAIVHKKTGGDASRIVEVGDVDIYKRVCWKCWNN